MSGTSKGGQKAKITNYKRFGKDFYKNIGHKGGTSSTKTPRGFAANPELAKIAGRKGGEKSFRTAPLDSKSYDKIKKMLEKDLCYSEISKKTGWSTAVVRKVRDSGNYNCYINLGAKVYKRKQRA